MSIAFVPPVFFSLKYHKIRLVSNRDGFLLYRILSLEMGILGGSFQKDYNIFFAAPYRMISSLNTSPSCSNEY
jgi:hypothetical protein